MGWNEFWGWALSDDDESYWEHLERDYGKDAPVIHAIMDTAVDTVVNFGGISYALNDGKPAISKETRDDVWEERHEILSVASCVPAIGTVAGAVDATLHAAESVENNVEFFVEGAVSEDEPIYDENGNIIGWKDKWMTDKMNEKRKYAQEHGVNATVNAVLTMTGANYFKGGKAAVQASKKGGNIIEKIFIKNVDEAEKAVANVERVTVEGAENVAKAGTKAKRIDVADKAYKAEKAAEDAKYASKEAEYYKKEAETWKQYASQTPKNETYQKLATEYAEKAEGAVKKADEAKKASQAAQEAAVAAEKANPITNKAAERARQEALQNLNNAKEAASIAQKKGERGMKAIDFLQKSNNIRSFLVTAYTLGSLIPGDTPQK